MFITVTSKHNESMIIPAKRIKFIREWSDTDYPDVNSKIELKGNEFVTCTETVTVLGKMLNE